MYGTGAFYVTRGLLSSGSQVAWHDRYHRTILPHAAKLKETMIYGHVETHFPTRLEEPRRVLHLRPARFPTGEPRQVLYGSLEQLQEDLAHVDAVSLAFAGSHDTFVHVDQAAPLLRTLWPDWGER